MNIKRTWIAALLAGMLLAACGGGEAPLVPGTGSPAGAPTAKATFRAVVSFGDSLSDVGAYAPATSLTGNGQAPFFGGKFTTNSATGTVWVENIATSLGLLVTPHEVGFAGQSVKCPAAANPALASTCTGYGQGGARVTNPAGIGRDGGALTVPVRTQIANHLARFGNFRDSDLIFVYAGSNDVFANFGVFGAKAAAIQADAAAGRVTPDQANNLLLAAQLEGLAAMRVAAEELAAYVRSEILAKGGRYVVVMTLSDIADTPFGGTLAATARPVLTAMSENFNTLLRDGLTNQPVQLVDTLSFFKNARANPAQFGITNVNVPACDATKIAAITANRVTDGSSLFCNATAGAPFNGLRTGADANTWFFADAVHPTTGGHRVFSNEVLRLMRSWGWI